MAQRKGERALCAETVADPGHAVCVRPRLAAHVAQEGNELSIKDCFVGLAVLHADSRQAHLRHLPQVVAVPEEALA